MKVLSIHRDYVWMNTKLHHPLRMFRCTEDTSVFDPYKGTIRRFKKGRIGAIFFYPEEDCGLVETFLKGFLREPLVKTEIEGQPFCAYHWGDIKSYGVR